MMFLYAFESPCGLGSNSELARLGTSHVSLALVITCFGHGVKKRLADFTGFVTRERSPYGQFTTAPVRAAAECTLEIT